MLRRMQSRQALGWWATSPPSFCVQMDRCPTSSLRFGTDALSSTMPPSLCVQVELALPELLSRIDFVTMDSNSGAVDNNG